MVDQKFNIITVSEANLQLLETFLQNAGNSLDSFRYFSSRPLSIITNHIITILLVDDNNLPVAYGHLDKDGDIVWLGIAVAENMKGKGLGKQIMNYLVEFAKLKGISSLHLSVDKSNTSAIGLYKKFGFTNIGSINDRSIKMQAHLSEG